MAMRQLPLFSSVSPSDSRIEVEPEQPPATAGAEDSEALAELRRGLAANLRQSLASITLTRNKSRILSSRHTPDGRLHLRLDHCFVGAPVDVLQAVAAFLDSPAGSPERRLTLKIVRAWFDRHRDPVVTVAARGKLQPRGRVYDLREIRDEICRGYLGGELAVAITWGRGTGKRACRRRRSFTLQLGSYDVAANLVRIHPVLDRPEVPHHVVAAVVYHELLHAVLPPTTHGGRRRIHSPEFRRRERLYEKHREAEAWLAANLERLSRVRWQ